MPKGKNSLPKRTRAHRIADLSAHHVEGFVLRKGYIVEELRRDYGYDLALFTFDYSGGKEGEFENGSVKIQLKATDAPTLRGKGKDIAFVVERRHLRLWRREPAPVILILYDAPNDSAYWLHLQPYLKALDGKWEHEQDSLTVYIPRANVVNEEAVEQFRRLKQEYLQSWEEWQLRYENDNPA